MHLGNVFCALLAWLFARRAGGEMVLRIEDLDPERCRPAYAAQLEDDLRWLGLDWDMGGAADPQFCQSARIALYDQAYRSLSERGLLYPCFCTRAQRAASAPHRSDRRAVYSGHCRSLLPEETARLSALRRPAFRLRVPEGRYSFTDGLQGTMDGEWDESGDFIVRRADGVFAYQLAVVVDDALMGVTQVVRGRDLLDSTPQQLLLYQLLGYPPPAFFHIPLLLAHDGRRLSKRDKDLDLGRLRSQYRAEEIIGRLAWRGGILNHYEPVPAHALISCFRAELLPQNDIYLSENGW